MIHIINNFMKYTPVFCFRRVKGMQNTNIFLKYVFIPKRCVQQKRPSHEYFLSNNLKKTNDEKITPLGWFLLLIPVTTFGLGCWQFQRKIWKEELIHDLEKITQMPPIDLPENLDILNDMEYRAVKVRGRFLHDKELYMGPRSLIKANDASDKSNGLMSQRDGTNGYLVITPFLLAGRNEIILINRGWISRQDFTKKRNAALNCLNHAKDAGNEIELVGLVRRAEQRPQFTPQHKGELFLYRDLTKMCNLTGAKPIFLDAVYDGAITDGPIGGQTRVTLRNDHLSYLITWFSLSLATSIMWYRTIFKRTRY